MKKNKMYTLKNGLRLIFHQDTSKHSTIVNLFVKFGGIKNKVLLDNNLFDVSLGTAHFIEHLLIEHSIYGNALTIFEDNHTRFNGYTNKDITHFYIDCVYNIEKEIVKLINIVNKPNFNENSIQNTKPAIIKEIMIDKDDKFSHLNKLDNECVFQNVKYTNMLGEVNDIQNIKYDYIKKCYDIFYRVDNQILFVSGNFNLRKIKRLIESTYKKIENKKMIYKSLEYNEPLTVVTSEGYIIKDVYTDYVRINYKVNVSNFKPKELVKLTFYLEYFLSYLFSVSSKITQDLLKKKVCTYDINYSYEKVDNFMLIKIGTFTNNHEVFINNVKSTIKKGIIDKDDFELRKRKDIINLILREDNLRSMIGPFIDNIISYGYYGIDTIEDIQKLNYEEYEKIIKKIDFSNYCITKILKKEK